MEAPDLQPLLKGSLVTLRPVQANDWGALFKAASDPKTWVDHTPTCQNRYQEDVFRAFFNDALSSGGALVVIDNATGKIIGSSRYNDFKPDAGEIEIGWTFITNEYWGRQYNAEIKDLMLTHIFQYVDVVVFWVAKDNLRSQFAMKKIGGVLRDGEVKKTDKGQIVTYVIFEIRKEAR